MANNTKKSSGNGEMTFFEHIDALRPHLVRGAFVLFSLTVVAFMMKGFIIDKILFGPKSPDFPTNRAMAWLADRTGLDGLRTAAYDFKLINTSLMGQLNLHLQVAFMTALTLTIPYLLWEVWRFIKPALTPRERQSTNKFVFYVSFCFIVGLCFGYFMISPFSVNFLVNYNASPDIQNLIDVGSYLKIVLNVSLASAAVFQLPILVYFLSRMGILTPKFMRRYRKHATIILVLFAMVITPPDLVSATLVAIPLYLLYELSINISARVRRQMDERRAKEEAAFHSAVSTMPTTPEE